MRTELAKAGCSPLESLLIDRVVASWLQIQYFEVAATHVEGVVGRGEANYMLKRLDTTTQRHLAAIKALAAAPSRQPASISSEVRRMQDKRRIQI